MNALSKLQDYVAGLERRMAELQMKSDELDAQLLALNPPRQKLDFSQFSFRTTALTQDVRVWKDECALSFATPYSPGGLFTNLLTLTTYSRAFVEEDWRKSAGRAIYLHQEWTWSAAAEGGSETDVEQEVKRLAIGVEGGFVDKSAGTCNKAYSLRVGPDFSQAYALDLLEGCPDSLQRLIKQVVERDDASKQTDVLAWEAGQELKESRFAASLIQVPNPPRISSNPAHWKCEESGITENLWLNLSDGYIGSGRANWDGTGGTGAALKHFHDTGAKYPLAVKLGTISKDGKTADVYSYAEDDMVIDPLLPQHLAHFGIVTQALERTDKTLSEMEVDLNSKYDWSRISQEGETLPKVSGSHCVGLENLGNSCYCNSVFQLLFGTDEFAQLVREMKRNNNSAGGLAPERDLAVQLNKLGNAMSDPVQHLRGLLAPHQRVEEQDFVSPKMLKHLLGEGHRDFSTKEQQDAAEYVLHVLERIRRAPNCGGGAGERISDLFRFSYEERSQCLQSNTVRYAKQANQMMLSLVVPPEMADSSTSCTLGDCLDRTFAHADIVDGFLSPETGARGQLQRSLRIQSFPKLLLVQLKRFVLKDDMSWEAVKLDGKIALPLELDLQSLASKGLQPGEQVMREASATPAQAPAAFIPNEQVVESILELGFSRNGALRAAKATNNDVEQAMQWVMEHMEDADFNDALPESSSATPAAAAAISSEAVGMLASMGFDASTAEFALQRCNNDVERAADYLFNRSAEELAMEMLTSQSNSAAAPAAGTVSTAALDSESKRYHLRAVVSHIGKSTSSGHYVCHFNQSPPGQVPRWVFFNDAKVVLANQPPLDLGYLLLYQQI